MGSLLKNGSVRWVISYGRAWNGWGGFLLRLSIITILGMGEIEKFWVREILQYFHWCNKGI